MPGVLFFLFLILAMWVVVVLPQQRRQRAHQRLVSSLEVGQEVMTTAGVYGTIRSLEGDVARLEVAEGVEIRIARRAILRPVLEAPVDDGPDGEVGDLLGAAADQPATADDGESPDRAESADRAE